MRICLLVLATATWIACGGDDPDLETTTSEIKEETDHDTLVAYAESAVHDALPAKLAKRARTRFDSIRRRVDGHWIVRFELLVNDVPVLGLRMRADVAPDGSSVTVPIPTKFGPSVETASTLPKVTEAGAVEAALKLRTPAWIATERTLVLRPIVNRTETGVDVPLVQLVYQVKLRAGSNRLAPREIVYVDAGTGKVLEQCSLTETVVATGHSYHSLTVQLEVREPPWPGYEGQYTMIDPMHGRGAGQLGNRVLSGGTYLPGLGDQIGPSVSIYSTDLEFGNGQIATTPDEAAIDGVVTPAGETAGVDVAYATARYWDMLWSVYRRLGTSGTDTRVDSFVNIDMRYEDGEAVWQAEYVHDDHVPATVYSLPTEDMPVPPTSPDIVAHELTHGLTNTHLGLACLLGGQHVKEGLSDIFAISFKHWLQAPGSTIPNVGGQWKIIDLPGVHGRYFHKPSLDARPDPWGGTSYSNDAEPGDGNQPTPHLMSGGLRRAFYFLAQGIPQQPGIFPPGPYAHWAEYGSTFLPEGLTGIGNHAALDLFYRAITTEMSEHPNLPEVRRSVAAVAAQRTSHCSPTHKAVMDAFAAVNIGAKADRTAPAISFNAWRVPGGVQISTTASDAGGIESHSIGVSGFALGLQIPLNETVFVPLAAVPQLGAGNYEFELTVTDTCQNTSSKRQTVYLYNSGPRLSQREEPGPLPRSKLITIHTTASTPLREITFYPFPSAFGAVTYPVSAATSYTFQFNFDSFFFAHGWTQLRVVATDIWGASSEISWSSFLDKKPPSQCDFNVGFNREVWLAARASDPESLMKGVEFFIDGALVGSKTGTGPVFGGWTVTVETGNHEFAARCIDVYGNSTTSTVNRFVSAAPEVTLIRETLTREQVTIRFIAVDDLQLRTMTLRDNANGVTLGNWTNLTDTAAEVTVSYDLTNLAPGTRVEIRGSAFDEQINGGYDMFEFTVPSPPPPPNPETWIDETEPNNYFPMADVLATNPAGARGRRRLADWHRQNGCGADWCYEDLYVLTLQPGESAVYALAMDDVFSENSDDYGTRCFGVAAYDELENLYWPLGRTGPNFSWSSVDIPGDWPRSRIAYGNTSWAYADKITNITNGPRRVYFHIYLEGCRDLYDPTEYPYELHVRRVP